MGIGRIPGPYGKGEIFGCILRPGIKSYFPEVYREFPDITRGPMGTTKDLGATVAESTKKEDKIAKENEAELKLLVKVYGTVKNKSAKKSYTYWKKGKKQYRVKDYVNDRNAFFGSAKEYRDFRDKAREELEADNGKLRSKIEPPYKKRKKLTDWKRAQDVFYAWVRKAYQKKLGEKVEIPKLIKSQMSEKLKKALKQVKVDYGKNFQHGGFNPRPMKRHGYRLGTISEHAVGNAIDIESSKNAHILANTWKNILSFTGKSLDRSTRKSQWKTSPKKLYDSIKEINDEFVSKLAKTIKSIEETAKKNAEAEGATDEQKKNATSIKANPLGAAIKENADLEKIGIEFLREWKNGFFDLPWTLVKELHEEGLLWGATFSDPDLHHFEL